MMSREKQIDEMAKAICEHYIKGGCGRCPDCVCEGDALKLYNAGYRKNSAGEWVKDNASQFKHRYNCSVCDYRFLGIPTPYCPNCGAKMGGGGAE